MKSTARGVSQFACILFLGILFMCHVSSFGMSRMEKVNVSAIDGKPCFSLPADSITSRGVPFYSIMVSETRSTSFDELPTQMWGSSVMPYGNSIVISSKKCIRYGELLPLTSQRVLKDLEPLKIYSVFIKAGSSDDGLIGYSARFCLIPVGNGPMSIVQILSNGTTEAQQCKQ